MFEQEIDDIYYDIGYSIRTKTEMANEDCRSEILYCCRRILAKMEELFGDWSISVDTHKLENIIYDNLLNELNRYNNKIFEYNREKLTEYAEIIKKTIIQNADNSDQNDIGKIRSKHIDVMDIFWNCHVDLSEQFEEIIRSLRLHDNHDLVWRIHQILEREKGQLQDYFVQNIRGISRNVEDLVNESLDYWDNYVENNKGVRNLTNNEQKIIVVAKKQMLKQMKKRGKELSFKYDNLVIDYKDSTVEEISTNFQQNGLNFDQDELAQIIESMERSIWDYNDKLVQNMVLTFININYMAIDSVAQTFLVPDQKKELEMIECLKVFEKSSSLKDINIDYSNYFNLTFEKICTSFGITNGTKIYEELFNIFEGKKEQFEKEIYDILNLFSKSNFFDMEIIMISSHLSQRDIKNNGKDLEENKIERLMEYNGSRTIREANLADKKNEAQEFFRMGK